MNENANDRKSKHINRTTITGQKSIEHARKCPNTENKNKKEKYVLWHRQNRIKSIRLQFSIHKDKEWHFERMLLGGGAVFKRKTIESNDVR